MAITLGCPSCGKRFKARDESAGKKVKCPYCQVAVQVPTPEESARAGAPTAPIPVPDSVPVPGPAPRPTAPPPPAIASPAEWGALPSAPAPAPNPPPAQDPPPVRETFPPLIPSAPARGAKERPKPAKSDKADKGASDRPAKLKGTGLAETPTQVAAAGWRSVRRGLFWVQFGLLWLALIGFIGFGKAVYTRAVGELPKGDGTSWVSIEGYVNAPGPNAVPLSKTDLMNLALYAIPVFIASVCVVFGRLIASGAPRSSGARSLFAFSAMFALLGVVGLFCSFAFERLLLKEEYKYSWFAFLLLLPLAEFWFLTAVTASGLALKRPKAARAVGAVGFAFALTAFVATVGWDLYQENWRPKKLDDDVRMYEQAALLLGWVFLVGVYWRAVRNVRVAAREYLDTVEDG